MTIFQKPKSIIFTTILPLIVLALLFIKDYFILNSILTAETKIAWQFLLLTIGILIAISTGLLYSLSGKQKIPLGYHFYSVGINIVFMLLYLDNLDQLVPWNIPNWMIGSETKIYGVTFLMPALIHSFIALVIESKNIKTFPRPVHNFLFSALIPLAYYVFVVAILPLWDGGLKYDYVISIGSLFFLIPFVFLIIRGFYLWYMNAKDSANLMALEITFSIVLPFIGLALNNFSILGEGDGIFGDFDSFWFFGICFLNGIFLILKPYEKRNISLFFIIGRMITYPFTLYFFIVFLPFIPLAFPLIILLGIGIVMLSPSMLFFLHTKQIKEDYLYLKAEGFSRLKILLLSLSLLFIPIMMTIDFKLDKKNFNQLLKYTFENTPIGEKSISHERATKSLSKIANLDRRNNNFNQNDIPYINSYYNWLVFDNLSLSKTKIEKLQSIINDNPSYRDNNSVNQLSYPKIKSLTNKSTFNTNGYFVSQLDFELINDSEMSLQEYATTFNLPAGVYISDYYLYVGDIKKKGLLAEKKSATWIYERIRNTNKDPGILYYSDNNEISFKVFPFAKQEIRKTGFTLIHKESFDLKIDNKVIALGNSKIKNDNLLKKDHSYYLSNTFKKTLLRKTIESYPYYIIDASKNTAFDVNKALSRIKEINKINGFENHKTKICFSNFKSVHFNKITDLDIKNIKKEGGFFLGKSILEIITQSMKSPVADAFPVIIVLSNDIENSIFIDNFGSFSDAFPGDTNFYSINDSNIISRHSLIHNPSKLLDHVEKLPTQYEVGVLEDASKIIGYVNLNGQSQILHSNIYQDFEISEKSENKWLQAFQTERKIMQSKIDSENSQALWLETLKSSFASGVMNPNSSYIVLENEAQEKILKQKQAQVMSGNKHLSPDQDLTNMDEPSIFIFFILIVVFVLIRKIKLVNLIKFL
jgi:hypothetical protein